MLSVFPVGFVRTRISCASPRPAAFLARTCISYSVSGFRSAKEKCVSGVSKPKLQAWVPGLPDAHDVGQPGFPFRLEDIAVLHGQTNDPGLAVPLDTRCRLLLPSHNGSSAVTAPGCAGCDCTGCREMVRTGGWSPKPRAANLPTTHTVGVKVDRPRGKAVRRACRRRRRRWWKGRIGAGARPLLRNSPFPGSTVSRRIRRSGWSTDRTGPGWAAPRTCANPTALPHRVSAQSPAPRSSGFVFESHQIGRGIVVTESPRRGRA